MALFRDYPSEPVPERQNQSGFGRQEGHPACKKLEWWGAGMVICLERDADLHMAQLMPLPLTISCFSKSRLVLPFWYRLSAHPGSPRKRAVKRVCVRERVSTDSVMQFNSRVHNHENSSLAVCYFECGGQLVTNTGRL